MIKTATYIVENLKGIFRFAIIEAENKEIAVSKFTKEIIGFVGIQPNFDLEVIIREKIRELNDGEVIYGV